MADRKSRRLGARVFRRCQDRRTARERERARAKRTKRREWFQFDVIRTVFYLTLRFRRCQILVIFTLICFGKDLLRTFTGNVLGIARCARGHVLYLLLVRLTSRPTGQWW